MFSLTTLAQFSPHKGAGNSIVTTDQGGQIDIEQGLILHAHAAIDDAQVDTRWMTEDKRGQRIMWRAAGEFQRIETIADEVGSHAGGKIADIVTTQDGRASSRCQPESFPCAQ